MPTNLYGPNDNYNLETSHVLPALIRKFHLGKCLETNDWEALRKDLNIRPIENIDGNVSEEKIREKLASYGIDMAPGHQGTKAPRHQGTITLWGTGKPFREFLHVDDLADACVHVFENINFADMVSFTEKEGTDRNIRNTHINIGSGSDLTIRELAEMVKEITGFKGEVKWDTEKPDGTYKKLLDSSKLNQLNWKSNIELKDGIEQNYTLYVKDL